MEQGQKLVWAVTFYANGTPHNPIIGYYGGAVDKKRMKTYEN